MKNTMSEFEHIIMLVIVIAQKKTFKTSLLKVGMWVPLCYMQWSSGLYCDRCAEFELNNILWTFPSKDGQSSSITEFIFHVIFFVLL